MKVVIVPDKKKSARKSIRKRDFVSINFFDRQKSPRFVPPSARRRNDQVYGTIIIITSRESFSMTETCSKEKYLKPNRLRSTIPYSCKKERCPTLICNYIICLCLVPSNVHRDLTSQTTKKPRHLFFFCFARNERSRAIEAIRPRIGRIDRFPFDNRALKDEPIRNSFESNTKKPHWPPYDRDD